MARLTAPLFLFVAFAALLFLVGCSGVKTEAKYPTGLDRGSDEGDIYGKPASIFGEGGLSILGNKRKDDDQNSSGGIGVNSFLWRATLDTISFMPLSSADPFGGVILTDWYQPDPEVTERFKTNVFILGRGLRSDGVRVRVFKQKLRGNAWVDDAVAKDTGRQLEDTILTRARQLRVAQMGSPDK